MNRKVKHGTTLLHKSVHRGYRKIVKVLIAAGADVNAKDRYGHTPLHLSAQSGHPKIVKVLLAVGADVNAEDECGRTPLHLSGEEGHLDIAGALISAGADINAKGKFGKTPLHYCIKNGHWNIAQLLLATGADVNARDKFGETPLHFSVQTGHSNITEALIAAGADVDAKDITLSTPLHCSVHCEHSDIAKALIAAGADVNARDAIGWTPLHQWACIGNVSPNRPTQREFIEILKSLITSGADVNIEDDNRKTPLDIVDDNIEILIFMFKYIILYTVSPKKPIFKNAIYMLNVMWNICEQQVEELKETFLGSSKVSLFEFLIESDVNKTALYASEENFDMNTAMISVSYFENFRIFTEDIRSKFFEGNERADLLFKSQTLLKQCSICKILPVEIVRKITEYLEVEDLKNVLRPFTYNC